ncbi:MAG: CsbD family protein [Microcystaceae cyanobacterium]
MISFQSLRRFFYTVSLTSILLIAIAFSFTAEPSWATSPIKQLLNPAQPQLALFERTKALGKDMEGKTQEAYGNVTGDPKNQMMGKAKQVEAKARNVAADVKDKTDLKGRTKAVAKNLEGKVQETKGNVTGDRGDQMAGKAKQAESQARNLVEDTKDNLRGMVN